jgi:hypothetical protein
VNAVRFFTREDNGLNQSWVGSVWLNPPFSKPGPWVERWLFHDHPQKVILTSNDTSTRWAQDLLRYSVPVFLSGRTQFHGPGVRGTSNRSGHIMWFATDFGLSDGSKRELSRYGVVTEAGFDAIFD